MERQRAFLAAFVQENRRLFAPALLLLSALVLGGGGPHGPLQNGIVEALALLIIVRLPFRSWRHAGSGSVAAVMLIALLMLVGVAQLIPLPFAVWTRLPGREVLADTLAGLDRARSAWPISLSPSDTRLTLLTLLPPITIFLSVILLGVRERVRLGWLVVGAGAASALLGFAQLAAGDGSLFPYGLPPFTRFPGVFSNSDHQATLLTSCIVLMAAVAVAGGRRRGNALPAIARAGLLICLVLGTLITLSRAGLVLLVVAAIFAGGLWAMDRAVRASGGGLRGATASIRTGPVGIAAIVVAILLAVGAFAGSYRWSLMNERLGDTAADARFSFWRSTIELIKLYFPVGSGLGTFDIVYEANESLADVHDWIVNHAHNDYLEFALETGLMGMILLALAVLWWLWRTIAAFRAAPGRQGNALARAGAAVALMIMLHSIVDYPLRTQAIGCLFGFACALLVMPVGEHDGRPGGRQRRGV